jgi:hypothetical protein
MPKTTTAGHFNLTRSAQEGQEGLSPESSKGYLYTNEWMKAQIGAELLLRIICNYVLRLKCRFPQPSKRGMAAAAHTAPHICHLKTLGPVIRGPEHMHTEPDQKL